MHTGKYLADFYPVVAKFRVRLQQHSVFLLRPTLLLDIGVKLVVPPFPALLARTWRVCTHVKLVWLRRIWAGLFKSFWMVKDSLVGDICSKVPARTPPHNIH